MSLTTAGQPLYQKPVIPRPRQIRAKIPPKRPFALVEAHPVIKKRAPNRPFEVSKIKYPLPEPEGNHIPGNPLTTHEEKHRGSAASTHNKQQFNTSQQFQYINSRFVPLPDRAFTGFVHKPKPQSDLKNAAKGSEGLSKARTHVPYSKGDKKLKKLKNFTNVGETDKRTEKLQETLSRIVRLGLKAGSPNEAAAARRNLKGFLNKHNLPQSAVRTVLQNERNINSRRLFSHSRFGAGYVPPQDTDVKMF